MPQRGEVVQCLQRPFAVPFLDPTLSQQAAQGLGHLHLEQIRNVPGQAILQDSGRGRGRQPTQQQVHGHRGIEYDQRPLRSARMRAA
ncbi:MAG: hypothetical protein ACRD2D_04500, partial [Terriglobales bacterium]